MQRPLRQLLFFLLALSLLPGWSEMLENLEHLVHDGHFAHLSIHDGDEVGHPSIEIEHGCTPLRHSCPCHTSLSALLPDDLDLSLARAVHLRGQPPTYDRRLITRANAPPVPPPTA
ncbi:MAG TPA: hypothetical protein ENK18_12785 [Deltaproteobacteria bacterium]|nr:hypothetical protein [Deltaproteobacteria bacterium]